MKKKVYSLSENENNVKALSPPKQSPLNPLNSQPTNFRK